MDLLLSCAEASHGVKPERGADRGAGGPAACRKDAAPLLQELAAIDRLMAEDHELDGILRALDGRFLRPAPGGDLLRTPAILPTGRNLHGFDPFRIPSAYAVKDGFAQAQRLLDKHMGAGNPLPESIAMVLWGTDNLKSEGGPIAQALALMGARPRFDSYGRLAGAELIALAELGRPRIDVVITLSGIFRDLLPLQIKLLAEAAFLAAQADEPPEQNFIRKHALAYQAQHGGDLETASLRVFGNAEGAYGSNINSLIDNSRWEDGDELAETYSRRKGFAYGVEGRPVQQAALLQSVLADVQLAYQNLDSVELGITTVDTYFDTLGGVSRAIKRAKVRKRRPGIGQRPDGPGLYRRPDPRQLRRRHGAHPVRAGGAGNPHPHAQPQVVRGHAQARLRRRAPDRGPCDQHHGLVGHHRPGPALGLRTAQRHLHAGPRHARAPGPAEPHRLGAGGQPIA